MPTHSLRTLLLLVFLGGSLFELRAGPPEPDAETSELIEQLGSSDFAIWTRAAQQLDERTLDEEAIPLLKQAAEQNHVLGSQTAIKLLAQLAREDSDLGGSAREALQELSLSDQTHLAAMASQVLSVLNSTAEPEATRKPENLSLPSRRTPMNQNVHQESVQFSVTNGERHIEVQTPDRQIDIQDRDGKQIQIKVTETEGPKERTYSAGDIHELKQAHPEIAELYEKYTSGSAEGPIGLGRYAGLGPPPGFGGPPGIGGPQFRGPHRGPPQAVGQALEIYDQVEACLSRLAKVKKGLTDLEKEPPNPESIKHLLDELDAAKKDLFAVQAKLGVK